MSRFPVAATQSASDVVAILKVRFGFVRPRADSPSVVVVMGAQVIGGGRPSGTLRARTLHAARMYRSGRARGIIVTGGVGENPPSEASVMSGLLRDAGVPECAITEEPVAKSTWESALIVSEMLRPGGDLADAGEICVVTDPLHCVRTVEAFRECGVPAVAEAVYESPSWVVGKMRTEQLFREMGAALWYRFRHGVGSRTPR